MSFQTCMDFFCGIQKKFWRMFMLLIFHTMNVDGDQKKHHESICAIWKSFEVIQWNFNRYLYLMEYLTLKILVDSRGHHSPSLCGREQLAILPNYLLLCSTEERKSWVSKFRCWINGFHFRVYYSLSLEVVRDEGFLCGLCKNMVSYTCLYTTSWCKNTDRPCLRRYQRQTLDSFFFLHKKIYL